MVKELMHDPIFLARKSQRATAEDLQTAQDLLDTLSAHKQTCVGMAANMIGVCRNPTCPSEEKLKEVLNFIDEKIEQYASDHEALTAQYNEGDVPQCVKVEADTVYFNLIKVLNKIKEIIHE